MKNNINLLQGNIISAITKLALPLMGMSLLQTAYSLTDMFWIGRLGSGAVAAVGTGGLLIWLSGGIHMLTQVGGQVYVAQKLGADDKEDAGKYAHASIFMSLSIGVILGLIFFFFRAPITSFFNLGDPEVVKYAETYISIVGGFVVFYLNGKLLTSLITATGNSKVPFIFSAIGLVANMILDPIMILGLLGCPKLGVAGAAYATVIAQLCVFLLLGSYILRDKFLFCYMNIKSLPSIRHCKQILKLSFAPALQGSVFPFISMIVSRMVADFGYDAVAVQRVGSQVESLSWMTSEGFAIAVNSFIAQNYGAKNAKRAQQGFFAATKILTTIGLITTALLIFLAEPIFLLFLPEPSIASMGASYLTIVGLSQLFMCYEILSNSSMNALGKSVAPALCIIIFTAMRIPLGAILSSTSLGIDGIWWAVSITTMFKGLILAPMVLFALRKIIKNTPLSS